MSKKRRNRSKHPHQHHSQGSTGQQQAVAPVEQTAATTSGGVRLIAQQRAKHALDKITAYKEGHNDEAQKRFNSYVSSLGPMILMNGFGQACAFYLANNKDEHQHVLNMLYKWLQKEGRPLHGKRDEAHIVARIVDLEVQEYRLAQAEALAYLDWLKKFARAFLKSDADDTEEAEDAAAA